MGSQVRPSGGGSSAPQLPQWTWAGGGGTPAAGTFTSDNDTIASAETLTFSGTLKSGCLFDLQDFVGNSQCIILADEAGNTSVFQAAIPITITGGNFVVTGGFRAAASGSFSGVYSASFAFIFANGINTIADGTYPVSSSLGGSNTYQSGLLVSSSEAS